MGARNIYVKDGDLYSRKVIIKAKYVKNNGGSFKEKIRAHLSYIGRDHAGKDSTKPDLFSNEATQINIKNATEKFSQAEHNFRFIISPENGDKINLKEFSQTLVKNIETDLGVKLDWLAACHYDTNEPHVHLVISGKDKLGKKVLMSRDYISRGIRNRASQIVNKKLGIRSQQEVSKALEFDAVKNQKSILDVVIKNHIKDELLDTSRLDLRSQPFLSQELIESRLAYLASKEMASYESGHTWRINPNYTAELQQLSRTSTMLEHISGGPKLSKENLKVISSKTLDDVAIKGYVVERGYIDESGNDQYLVIKTEAQTHFYVELEKYSEKARSKVGDLVSVTLTKPFAGPKSSDVNVDLMAKAHGGVYDAVQHQKYSSQNVKLPPGVDPQEFVQVHIKRLEVLARMGFVQKLAEGSFKVPTNFLPKIKEHAEESKKSYQSHLKVTLISPPKMTLPKISQGLKR